MFVLISVFVDSEFCSKLSASFEKRNNADMSDINKRQKIQEYDYWIIIEMEYHTDFEHEWCICF